MRPSRRAIATWTFTCNLRLRTRAVTLCALRDDVDGKSDPACALASWITNELAKRTPVD